VILVIFVVSLVIMAVQQGRSLPMGQRGKTEQLAPSYVQKKALCNILTAPDLLNKRCVYRASKAATKNIYSNNHQA
jgi:hypothetical protein